MRTITGAVMVVLLAGCGSGSSSTVTVAHQPTRSATASPTAGTLTLEPVLQIKHGPSYSPNWRASHGGCRGANGYDDLHVNAGVTLYGPNGDVVGSGFITDSRIDGSRCVLTATVDDVQRIGFYKVQFANRNEVAFSLAQLQDQSAYLTIG